MQQIDPALPDNQREQLCLKLCREHLGLSSPSFLCIEDTKKPAYYFEKKDGTLHIGIIKKPFAQGLLKAIHDIQALNPTDTTPLAITSSKVAVLPRQETNIPLVAKTLEDQKKLPREVTQFTSAIPTSVPVFVNGKVKQVLLMPKYAGSFEDNEWTRTDGTKRQMKLSDIPKVITTMVQPLIHMREHGKAHGDVKPPNFLINIGDNDELIAYLHDFDATTDFGNFRSIRTSPYADIPDIVTPFCDVYALSLSLTKKVFFEQKYDFHLFTYLGTQNEYVLNNCMIVPKINTIIQNSSLKDLIEPHLVSCNKENYISDVLRIIEQLPPSPEKEQLLKDIAIVERTIKILQKALQSNAKHITKLQDQRFKDNVKNYTSNKKTRKFYQKNLLTLEEIVDILNGTKPPIPPPRKSLLRRLLLCTC
jgi:serine/threonine protein kinase